MSLQRDAYLLSRFLGDVHAARRGPLLERLVRRQVHRRLLGLLRKWRLW